jgi:NADH dehydrogenase [ubiquinone] 1 alpha subcomplex assembly factor 1
MKYILILALLSAITKPNLNMNKIYIFSTQTNIKEWNIVNDGVMGGISKSSLVLTDMGYGQFSGHVSLENYGGFASVQINKKIQIPEEIKFIVLRIKGDRKGYEFRLKGKTSQSESYVHPFKTSGEWQNIKLAIGDFYPQFRGNKLNSPNFNFKNIEQMSFLIANKQEEDFKLLIDWIGFE